MPNTTWTRRAEAPTQRKHTTEQGKTRRASQSPNPPKTHTEQEKKTRGKPKPQHREITHQNGTQHMERAEAPTQRQTHGASRSPNPGKGSRRPKIPTTRKNKNRPTRRGEEARKTKARQRKQKEKKQGRQRKAKDSTGTKKGEKKRRRADRPARGRRENESMVAWANHRNGTGKSKNPINGNLQTGPSQSPSSGRHSNISNPVGESGHCHTCADFGEGEKGGAHREPTLIVPPPGSS